MSQRPSAPKDGGSRKSPGQAATVDPVLAEATGSGLSFGLLVAAIALLGALVIVLLRVRRDEDDEPPAAPE